MRLASFVAAPLLFLTTCSSDTTSVPRKPDAQATGSGGANGNGSGSATSAAGRIDGGSPVATDRRDGGLGSGGSGPRGGNGGTTASGADNAGAAAGSGGASHVGGGTIYDGGTSSTSGGGTNGGTSGAGEGGANGGITNDGGAWSSNAGGTSSGGESGSGASSGGGNDAGTSSGAASNAGAAGTNDAGIAGQGGGGGCPALTTKLLTASLENPVYAITPPGDARLFILERTAGRVTIVDTTGKKVSTFLDISSRMNAAGFEAGLLSLAFHPMFAQNGAFYVTYTTASVLRVSRFTVPVATPNTADPSSEAVVIEVPQVSHHNTAGMLLFGPDGDLYVSAGDGDDQTKPQDLASLNGKMLRLAVDPAAPGYTTPPGNPFVGNAKARPEIWAYGLREPFRYWFDTTTNSLYIADVGASTREEIDVVPVGQAGLNFGWPIMEGTICHSPATNCSKTGLTLPVYDFPHDAAETAVIGGSVYRGSVLPACYRGKYFFGTYNSGVIDTLSLNGTQATATAVPGLTDPDLSSFARDASGELLVIDADQNVSRVVPAER